MEKDWHMSCGKLEIEIGLDLDSQCCGGRRLEIRSGCLWGSDVKLGKAGKRTNANASLRWTSRGWYMSRWYNRAQPVDNLRRPAQELVHLRET